jgi:hypothetical protein
MVVLIPIPYHDDDRSAGSIKCGGQCTAPAWSGTGLPVTDHLERLLHAASAVCSRLASAIQRAYSLRWVKAICSKGASLIVEKMAAAGPEAAAVNRLEPMAGSFPFPE